jgi:hypothetical protein
MATWLIVAIAVAAAAVLGSLALRTVARGRRRVPGRARHEARGRELSPREKLARDGGIASFGLNLPWWTRTESGRERSGGRDT